MNLLKNVSNGGGGESDGKDNKKMRISLKIGKFVGELVTEE